MTPRLYHLALTPQQTQLLSFAEVESGLATGRFNQSLLSWCEDEVNWVRLDQRPEFSHAVSASKIFTPSETFAWEAMTSFRGAWSCYWQTFGKILRRPQKVFTETQFAPRVRWAMLWFLGNTLGATVLGFLVYSPILHLFRSSLSRRFGGRFLSEHDAWVNLTYLIKTSGQAVWVSGLWLLSGTLLIQGCLRLMRAGKAGWPMTFRVLAYVLGVYVWLAMLPLGFFVIPILAAIAVGKALTWGHRQAGWQSAWSVIILVGATVLSLVAWAVYSLWSFFRNF